MLVTLNACYCYLMSLMSIQYSNKGKRQPACLIREEDLQVSLVAILLLLLTSQFSNFFCLPLSDEVL